MSAYRAQIRGFTLIEVLIALVILAFGMLSLARAMGRSSQNEFEALQRSQAIVIAQEMVERLNANRKEAALYVGDYSSSVTLQDCTVPPTLAARDRCLFENRLFGADIVDAGKAIGAPLAARACITSPGPNIYIVAVAWQGIVPTAPADSQCGAGMFDREENRRVFSTIVQIATLGA